MNTYNELMEQAKALMAQAEQVRKDELTGVVNEIKAKMRQYSITVDDLAGHMKVTKIKSTAAAKYRGPNGETWGGGPGRKPQWVRDLLDAGMNIEDYRI